MRIVLICLSACFASLLAAQPEMTLLRGTVSIADGATDSVTNPGTSPFNLNYTIQNDGTTDLTITGAPTITNEVNCTVTVLVAPSSPVAGTGGTTVFTLQISPLSTADFSFDVSIINDDADENPYNFSFSATPIGAVVSSSSKKRKSSGCAANQDAGGLGLLGLLVLLGVARVQRRRRSHR